MTRILYCHCAYAQVVPKATKDAVLENSARRASTSKRAPIFAKCPRARSSAEAPRRGTSIKIAACYPRAVRWLFHAAGALPSDGVQVLNMRVDSAEPFARPWKAIRLERRPNERQHHSRARWEHTAHRSGRPLRRHRCAAGKRKFAFSKHRSQRLGNRASRNHSWKAAPSNAANGSRGFRSSITIAAPTACSA